MMTNSVVVQNELKCCSEIRTDVFQCGEYLNYLYPSHSAYSEFLRYYLNIKTMCVGSEHLVIRLMLFISCNGAHQFGKEALCLQQIRC